MGGLAADRPPHQAGQVADRQRGGGWRTTGRGPGDRLRLAERAGLLGLAVEATDPRPYLDQEWFWDVRAFVERLTRAGYAARCTSVAAPLQIEGGLPSGVTFYFRAEYGAAQLIVPAPASPASGDERPWSGAVDRGAGGDWSVPAAERDFHELVGRYAAERGNDERG